MKYLIKCPQCHNTKNDDGYLIHCEKCGKVIPKILFSEPPVILEKSAGFGRYTNFLPGHDALTDVAIPFLTYKSQGLAGMLGLKNLYITVTGYSPEKGIYSPTCSFKELEAISVLRRLRASQKQRTLILSSAGNTARAFCYYAAKWGWPTIIVVPADSRSCLWLPHEEGLLDKVRQYIRVISVDRPSIYKDASVLNQSLSKLLIDSVSNEGGFGNIGRIAGLGLIAVSFYDEVKSVPDYYFQAVGSAAGTIAVSRIYDLFNAENGSKIRYRLVQNQPYTLLIDAINKHKAAVEAEGYLQHADTVCAPMLTSADPVYAYPGGILSEMQAGKSYQGIAVGNDEIYSAQYDFFKTEGIEASLPASGAVAGLIKSVKNAEIPEDAVIQLNVTGIGESRLKADKGYFYAPVINAPVEAGYDENVLQRWFAENFQTELEQLTTIAGLESNQN